MTWRTCCARTFPSFPGRTFRQYLTTNCHHINRRRPDAGPAGLGLNGVNWIVEQVTATQQVGTHMYGLNHLQAGDRTYNGFRLADIVEDHGTNRLGIDTMPQVVTRGLLLDLAAARPGPDRLDTSGTGCLCVRRLSASSGYLLAVASLFSSARRPAQSATGHEECT